MQYEIELFNLKFLYTCTSTYMLKLPSRHFDKMYSSKELRFKCSIKLVQVLNKDYSSSIEQ